MSSRKSIRTNSVPPAGAPHLRYKKGEVTRARILEEALAAFGRDGFDRVTTRQICQAAGITLPSLSYYFGGKEGLYLACAHETVAAYRENVGQEAAEVRSALDGNPTPNEAVGLLKRMMAALSTFLLRSERARSHAAFVQHELASPGPAFEVLYNHLWAPGVDLLATLVRQIAPNRFSENDARIRAFSLMSGLTGYITAAHIIERMARDIDPFPQILNGLEDQIEALGKS